jgi:hypothetical protein
MFEINLERVVLTVLIGVAVYTFATMTMTNPIANALAPISAVLTGK